MNLDKLAAYKLDPAFIDVHTITLDDAPDVEFQVVLPSNYNRAYMAEVYGGVQFEVRDNDSDGDGDEEVAVIRATTSVLEARDRQEKGFVKHCLISIDGEPVPANFAQEYPDAIVELMAKANIKLEAIKAEAAEAEKKSALSSVGSIAGAAG